MLLRLELVLQVQLQVQVQLLAQVLPLVQVLLLWQLPYRNPLRLPCHIQHSQSQKLQKQLLLLTIPILDVHPMPPHIMVRQQAELITIPLSFPMRQVP